MYPIKVFPIFFGHINWRLISQFIFRKLTIKKMFFFSFSIHRKIQIM